MIGFQKPDHMSADSNRGEQLLAKKFPCSLPGSTPTPPKALQRDLSEDAFVDCRKLTNARIRRMLFSHLLFQDFHPKETCLSACFNSF